MALLAVERAAGAQPCKQLAASNMVFTGYSPFGAGVSATSTITYNCPNKVTDAWIAISAPRVMTSGGDALTFFLTQSPYPAADWPTAPPLRVSPSSGAVTAHGFLPPLQDVPAGTYQVTLQVTLYSGADQALTDTATLVVSATFPPACTIAPATLAFGNYDPIGANATTPADAQGAIQIACTRNAAYTVALGPGNNAAGTTRQMANGADRLPYELYSDSGRATVWSTTATVAGTVPSMATIPLTVYGRIPAGQNVPAGTYGDTVLSTINF